ncbi:VPLPA-CTERM sorting domain-containing protein [Jannaschia sp. CCS1]|uniref:VPLPA-CTERM sorting domain-containing protein n=1 Tax=Jannaschia sp. (strain CCS1) TaxID=290400 RepID=UPI000053ABC7|nr:VPLPA-CTERM sorting domain-containing protein [Jannaschia sp. CCS1]ABD52936.1 hypothetical protein Jann_0019 [Jannaschia sp. CCS1]
MNIFKNLGGAILALGFAAGVAHANVINFETDEAGFTAVNTGLNGGAPVGPYAGPGGSTFTIDADTFSGSVPGDITLNGERRINITQGVEGLGVNNRNCVWFVCDGGQVDGFGSNDILIFTFDRMMSLSRIIFENVGRRDDFVLYVPGANPEAEQFDIVNPLPFPDTNGDEGFFDFGGLRVTSFGIGAYGNNDSFRVSRIEIAPVPLPAGAVLLLTGLGALALRRRQKTDT